MKMFYNMSARDRSLLILVLAAVLFYLSYTFIMTPALAVADVLTAEIQTTQAELERAKALMTQGDDLEKQERLQKEDLLHKYSVFFNDLNQARLLNKMDALMTSTGLTASSYAPSPETVAQVPLEQGFYQPLQYPIMGLAAKINPELQSADPNEQAAPASAEAPQEAVASEDMIPGADVVISFNNATYESIFGFIGSVEKMNKTVNLKSADITRSDTGLQGQLTFSFYSIPQIDDKQKDGLDFTPALPKGKANPFL